MGSMKKLPIARPTLLAPMEGVTHPIFRAAIAQLGAPGCVCTEFVRITATPICRDALAREVVKIPGVPLSVQVMGRELVRMHEAAEALDAAGADAIDINMGCPTKRAVRGGVGAAMLKDPQLLYDVVSVMRAAVTGHLSAKIRAGFEDKSRVVELAQIVQSAGADYIAVHPRTRADQYRGVADWRIIKTLKENLDIPVIGNGDVWYATDALRMLKETGCDAVMIGRPALRNPWIFRQIEELRNGQKPFLPNGNDVFGFLETLADRYSTEFGSRALGRLKELIKWVGRAIDKERQFSRGALRAQSLDAILDYCRDFLADISSDQLDLDAYGTKRYEACGTATGFNKAAGIRVA